MSVVEMLSGAISVKLLCGVGIVVIGLLWFWFGKRAKDILEKRVVALAGQYPSQAPFGAYFFETPMEALQAIDLLTEDESDTIPHEMLGAQIIIMPRHRTLRLSAAKLNYECMALYGSKEMLLNSATLV